MTQRAKSERERISFMISRFRGHLDSLEIALKLAERNPMPIGTEVGQGLVQEAANLAIGIAKHDAYELVERR